MKIYILVVIICATNVSANVKVFYKQTSGNVQLDIVPLLAEQASKHEIGGVRKLENGDGHEPLTLTWMASRTYEPGYSYYEKFVVIDEYDREPPELVTYLTTPGPLPAGSKITIDLMMPNPFNGLSLDLLDDTFPDIYYHLLIDYDNIRSDQFINGVWQGVGQYITADHASVSGLIRVEYMIKSDRTESNINNQYVHYVLHAPPGDTPTRIYVGSAPRSPYINWIKYERA